MGEADDKALVDAAGRRRLRGGRRRGVGIADRGSCQRRVLGDPVGERLGQLTHAIAVRLLDHRLVDWRGIVAVRRADRHLDPVDRRDADRLVRTNRRVQCRRCSARGSGNRSAPTRRRAPIRPARSCASAPGKRLRHPTRGRFARVCASAARRRPGCRPTRSSRESSRAASRREPARHGAQRRKCNPSRQFDCGHDRTSEETRGVRRAPKARHRAYRRSLRHMGGFWIRPKAARGSGTLLRILNFAKKKPLLNSANHTNMFCVVNQPKGGDPVSHCLPSRVIEEAWVIVRAKEFRA